LKPEQNKYDTDSPALLDVDQVSIYYDNIQAVWDVTFGVSGHSVTALVGSNGAGKTAIMKSISGLLPIAGGTILFEGKAIEKLPCHRRVALGISLVPEGRKVFPYLTTRENLELGAYTRQARKSLSKTLGHIYTLFPPLENRKKQFASSLSGGEQQMLSIGRGLMSCPRLLMLDEPSLGLAPLMVKLVFEIIETIKSEGVTILLVEQNVRHTLQCARTAYILETGKITLAGKGKDLLDDPHIKKAYLGL
jgi:branched-chain amino acid transport system ATP-binding protein